MKFKEQRKQQIEFLLKSLGLTLLEYVSSYNNETINYKCNNCDKIHKYDFSFLQAKIKYQQPCTCKKFDKIDDLNAYTLKIFSDVVKIIEEDKIKNNDNKKVFLTQEENQITHLICKNRFSLKHFINKNEIVIHCFHEHVFHLNYKDLISGKWCSQCAENNKYYFNDNYKEIDKEE